MASDREVLAHVRKKLGLQPGDLTDDEILKEVERGKREINRELRELLVRDGEVDVYELGEAAEDALKSYASFRARGKALKRGQGNPEAVEKARSEGIPKTVSDMRRRELPDSAMEQLRDQTVIHFRRMKNDGN